MSSQVDQLVKMANQIALNFGEKRDVHQASRKTAEHIGKFWTRGMRDQLWAHIKGGGANSTPAVHAALADLLDGKGIDA